MKTSPLPDVLTEGERNDKLTSLAGSMRRYHASEEAILAALREENENRCRPRLPEEELRTIARSVARYDPGIGPQDLEREAALRELNETYAVAQVGSDAVILQEREDDVAFLKSADFRLLHSKDHIEVLNEKGEYRRRKLADAWLEWEERRQFEEVVFEPSAFGEAGAARSSTAYNLWRGWAVTPHASKGSCSLFLKHLRYMVCGGNVEHYEWLLDWLADLFQNPQRKLGIVVALRGMQGVGKTIVGEIVKGLLGRYQIIVEKPGQVTGRFNGHLAYNLLLQVEEAFWAGDKRGQAVLKHLVTGKTQQIERKGVDSVEMPSYTRLLITSNEDWVWPADMDDRRLVIFDVKAKHRNDHDYFQRMLDQLADGGYEKLLHLLLHRKINEKRLRTKLPKTKAFEEQVIHSMPLEETWLLGVLKSGLLSGGMVDADGNAHVRTGELHEDYLETRPKHPLNAEQFGLFLSKSLPKAKGVKPRCRKRFYDSRGRGQQSQRRVIRPLTECRERYARRGRGAPKKWSKRTKWRVKS